MAQGLVIFDCDGVLVDSEPISLRVLVDSIGEAGHQIDVETAHTRFLGRSIASVCELLRVEDGVDLGQERLAAMRSRLYAAFREELQPISGIVDVLDRLDRSRLRRCVASSSQPERIRVSLEATGLRLRFEPNIFSATMVAAGKPAPDLFLYAAERMGARPDRSIVIEDSPAGIEAAKRAGMRVLAFTGGSHAKGVRHRSMLAEWAPDRIFDDMRELPGLLGA